LQDLRCEQENQEKRSYSIPKMVHSFDHRLQCRVKIEQHQIGAGCDGEQLVQHRLRRSPHWSRVFGHADSTLRWLAAKAQFRKGALRRALAQVWT
jgi:hypothetical protein